ncbi:MAG: hypothetical protein LUD71_02975 [Clostridiales bacterium]|nr:hypothetical protein [Clostridiales bacterium]
MALLALYVSTVVLACIGSDQALNLLRAAIYSTVVLPVLLWAYSLIYRLLRDHYSQEARERTEELRKHQKNETDNTDEKKTADFE